MTDHSKFLVVGIGASAGGLRAIEEILRHLPVDTGMAFVIVQHLSSKYKSLMKDILTRDTQMPVEVATDGLELEPNRIYLIPAGTNMTLRNGQLLLEDMPRTAAPSYVIDGFFHSLGRDAGKRAIAVVLSGTGTDGSRGIQTIKESGGIVMVQEPDSSEFDGMPLSAIDTRLVDLILPPERIAEQLTELSKLSQNSAERVRLVADHQPAFSPSLQNANWEQIIKLLKQAHSVDFEHYKVPTLQRRIEKHLNMHRYTSMERYYEALLENPVLLEELFQDLLIGVTEFFRDKEAFATLEKQVFPRILPPDGSIREIRIWVCACSTGEEVISLAIALAEYAETHSIAFKPTILATDIDPYALAHAGRGRYSPTRLKGMPSEYLAKYFDFNGTEYEVRSIIRDNIIYARNDATIDPPFINLDLIACRNLLIYLKPAIQRRLLLNFHFGLKSGGVLWLGGSENILDFRANFEVLSEKWKVFRTRGETPRMRRHHHISNVAKANAESSSLPRPTIPNKPMGLRSPRVFYTKLLIDRFAPVSLMFDEEFRLLYLTGGAGKYLSIPDMEVSDDLLSMVSEAVVFVLRDAMRRLYKEEGPLVYPNVEIGAYGSQETIDLVIERLSRIQERNIFLIRFQAVEEDSQRVNELLAKASVIQATPMQADTYEIIRDLQNELSLARQEVQNSMEELETSNEELQAANEELLAANEELQSTNEELQSVNEELYTVNSELQARNKDLSQANATVENIQNSSPIGILLLDQKLAIRHFTPSFLDVAPLGPNDIGNALAKFHLKWEYPSFVADLQTVIETGEPIEREVYNPANERTFLVYINPYFWEGTIDGVIVSKVNITDRVIAEENLKHSEANQRMILNGLPFVISQVDAQGVIFDINRVEGGYEKEKVIGTNFFDYHDEEAKQAVTSAFHQSWITRKPVQFETTPPDANGNPIHYRNTVIPIEGYADKEHTYIVASVNVTPEAVQLRELTQEKDRLAGLVHHASFVATLKDADYRYVYVSEGFSSLLKKSEKHIVGENDYSLFPEEIAIQLRANDEAAMQAKNPVQSIDRFESDRDQTLLTLRYSLTPEKGKTYLATIGIPFTLQIEGMDQGEVKDHTKLAELIESRTQALSQANLELKTITRSMAHDLRGPLRAIQTFGELLEENFQDNEDHEIRQYLDRIIHQSDRMASILTGLLSYVKLGSVEIKKEWIEPQYIAQSVWDDLQSEGQTNRGQLTLQTSPELWADKSLVTQILVNLFSNALKYCKPDTEAQVEFGGYKDTDTGQHVYYMRDEGIGFEPTEAERIFRIFERLTVSSDLEGYGLGLSIVKRAVELQGGRVWASSKVGTGATFYFSLPPKHDA